MANAEGPQIQIESRKDRAVDPVEHRSKWQCLICLILAATLWIFGIASPVSAAPLTIESLQQRIEQPVRREGQLTLDLRRLTLDLRDENKDFRERFYALVQTQLQRESAPVGLDLSYSTVLGDLNLQRLGLSPSFYGDQPGNSSEKSLEDLPGERRPLSDVATEQLNRDRNRLIQLGRLSQSLLLQTPSASQKIGLFPGPLKLVQTRVTGQLLASDTYFLNTVDAQQAIFAQAADWSGARFMRPVQFINSQFQQGSQFRNALFFERTRFNQTRFDGDNSFQNTEFRASAYFNQARFDGTANFSRTAWQNNVDFAQAQFVEPAAFAKAQFGQALFLNEAQFKAPVSFRLAQFSQPVNLRGATIQAQVDFGDARFSPSAYLNAADLEFNPESAQILGTPGQIGQAFSVPTLTGNETVLRNLVRNFRQAEQIADANQVEYTAERLRLKRLTQQIIGVNVNTASALTLTQLGLSPRQVESLLQSRAQQPFLDSADLLQLEVMDLATYVKIRDRIFTSTSLSVEQRLAAVCRWLGLSLLLLLSRYGTSVGLVFGVGLVAIALYGVMFWAIDRYRRRIPIPIIPPLNETICIGVSFVGLTTLGLSSLYRSAERPWLTLMCLGLIALPTPLVLLIWIYRRGRYHDLMDVSYFVQDGSARQIRLLIARLPVIPQFPFYRDRYTYLPVDRRWNWLNYYDFSLNNWFRFGFNDTRLRDQSVPGLITTLVWYQWALGVLYIALLLWTLSRTIPGLNLLLYF
ncbi:MAG: pentapeptide repeat-containing protein [Cyanobacteria bacterium P01_A01_bin.114]